MGIAINLDIGLVRDARIQSKIQSRSAPKQIEHWSRIGRIAEENPDLTYLQIKDMLLGLHEYQEGQIQEYKRGIL